MPLDNNQRSAIRDFAAWCVDALDLTGRPAHSVRGLPPLTDARIDAYTTALLAHWETITADLGIDLYSDDTAYDAAPGWDTQLETVRAEVTARLGAIEWELLRNPEWPIRRLSRMFALVVATARAAGPG